ncbi:hypothetical protein LJB90_00525 [Eubacteriales bacterium OttesenSCG-928-G02]|nr:hypothetical protein [Eubacteriales bacterium OttesenSCG-928-G02]
MRNSVLSRNDIENVARLAQKAFVDIRNALNNDTLSEEQGAAVDSLPQDIITKSARNRLKKFPNDCCADTSFVLAIIFTTIAEQHGFKYGQLKQIRCRPTDKTKMKMFDFHQWLRVDGYDVDIAFEQCKAVLKNNEGEIVFESHPLIGSDDYTYEQANAGIEEPFAEFANFIITNYFNRKEV